MQNILLDFVALPFFSALVVVLLVTPLVITVVKRFKLMDDPNRNHPATIHKKPIPRGGGIAMFLGAFLPAIFLLPITPVTLAIFFASFLALAIGVVDDKLNAQSKDTSPYLRFLVNILCAVIIVGSNVHIGFITSPFGGILHLDTIRIPLFASYYIVLADVLTMLWIVWVMNMLNWSKGVDGQMPGIVMISALVIGILSLRFPLTDPSVAIDTKLSFIVAGSSLGFLFYNFYPSKILPGYGATSVYLLLAVVSLLSSSKLATAILVMGVPTVDALFTIFRRLRNRRSVFQGDNMHLHHMLLRLGWSQRRIALFYWTISAILGIVALLLQSRSKLFAIIMLLVIVGGGLYFLHRVMQQSNEKTTS